MYVLFKNRFKNIEQKYNKININNCKFVIEHQAIFASCIPEIIDLIGTRPKYGGTLKNERGRR